MRCKNCNNEIEEYETFCKACKKELKKVSSKSEVEELEELIENQKKLNDLENTKELEDLDILVKEELALNNDENTNIIDIEKTEKIEVKREEIHNKKKGNKKALVIIVSIILVLFIAIIVSIILLKDNKEPENNIIDYKKVIKEYGTSVEKIVNDYILENNEIPTWQQINELIIYDKYDVVCGIHDIYSDGNIYLNSCKVNNVVINYSYGKEQEEIKEGKKIQIYKQDGEFISFTPTCGTGLSLVGTITCKTENCDYVKAYEKYVLIKEENSYYLYDYENDTLEFGPFNIIDENLLTNNMLVDNNKLYGIYYTESTISNIYNVTTGKILKNVKGTPLTSNYYFNPSIMYKYNYVAVLNNNTTNFINLKTGNVSYKIEENVKTFIEDTKNNIAYILSYTTDPNKFRIYNSNGKLLFDGNEYIYFLIMDENLLVADNNSFKVYDSNLKLQTSSKKYEKLLNIYSEYIIVVDDGALKILNYEKEELAVFKNSYNKNSTFDNSISGLFNENNKTVLNIYINNLDEPTIKYYYIPNENKSGSIKLDN